jgi:hypothetical protein
VCGHFWACVVFCFPSPWIKFHHRFMIINMDGKLCQVNTWWSLPIYLSLYLF